MIPQTSSVKTIGISTGGGDCPGLNAVIRGAVKAAIGNYGWKVIGIEDGFDGLIWPESKSRELKLDDVSGILPRGGTILGTTNRGNPFKYKVRDELGFEKEVDYSQRAIDNAKKLGIDCMLVIGGDGTQAIGLQILKKGLPVVGVPKTIDNDLSATDVTFGFDTALQCVTEAIDKIHTTAESHHRIMLVETMGREAGWIALESGIAGGAHVILLPEIPFTVRKVCDFVDQRHHSGKKFTIVVVAEGIQIPEDVRQLFEKEKRGAPRAGSVANTIGDAIGRCAHREVRVTVLGHIQRGGSPTAFDRVLSTRFGVKAVELIATGKFGQMVALRGESIVAVDIESACGQVKLVDPDGDLVRTAKAVGICFGD